jgi:GMP reductase
MMIKVNYSPKLDFKDVLIVPKKSIIKSRADVNINKNLNFKFSKQSWSGVPIISSNMDTVTDLRTFKALKSRGMISCMPKHLNKFFLESEILPSELIDVDYYSLSCGINKNDIDILLSLVNRLRDNNIFIKFICIDVANGYMINLLKTCNQIRKIMPNTTIIAGNVVTPEGVKDLIVNGNVDIIKIGIGSGLLCTTRKITGIGYPQFSAVLECAEEAHKYGAHIISDGGITYVGDISKALCAGADLVMLGSMLAGHDLSPGETIYEDGKIYKIIYGMSSYIANEKYSGGLQTYKAAEGKIVKLPFKGNIFNTINKIEGGLRSACSYIGSKSINNMYKNSNFIVVNRQYNDTLDTYSIGE